MVCFRIWKIQSVPSDSKWNYVRCCERNRCHRHLFKK